MSISLYTGVVPNRATQTQAQFEAAMNSLLAFLVGSFVTDVNSTASAMNLGSTNDTSASSVLIATGAKSFTVSAGKSFQAGMYLVIADTAAPGTNSMIAQVTSYAGTTLAVNVLSTLGSGTKTAWVISQSNYLTTPIGDHEVTVYAGNGHGSTNTKIRRFTSTLRSVGTAVTYADSATLGASFTINESGLYEIYYQDEFLSASQFSYGATVNSAELTTNILSTAIANRLLCGVNTLGGTAVPVPFTRTVRLTAGDVVRAHTNGSPNGTGNNVQFSIRKVGV